jgi:hypothetical protein
MKKGQAAMEFLMTYGWAILVVLAAIGALAYFGVLSPKLPNQCVMASGFGCPESKIMNDTVKLNLVNSIGYDLTGATITLAGQAPNTGCDDTITLADAPYSIEPFNNGASTGVINFTCSPLVSGKYKGTVTVVYTKAGESISHTATGTISGSIEQ